MNARTIRKLRKKISSFDKYIIAERYSSLYDDFASLERGKEVLAESPEMALRRYIRWCERQYKEISRLRNARRFTRDWAIVRVYNTRTEWKTYYM